jgi:uncharacterized protein involved in exopolysaccharide biosynthesis
MAGDSNDLQNSQHAGDDFIDLRQYLNVLVAWWKEILLFALLCGVAAGGIYWFLQSAEPPTYVASADVAIVRTISEVSFDERFTTQPETVAASNAAARRGALLALASSPSLAVEVVEVLGNDLPEELRNPALLAKAVRAALATSSGTRTDSDLIRITATNHTAETSAQIATAWAQAYVRNVNQVYGQVPNEIIASIQAEQTTAEADYAAAQQTLEDFVARSRVSQLSRQIADVESTIAVLRRGRQNTLNSLVDRTVNSRDQVAEAITEAQAENQSSAVVAELKGQRNLALAYIDAYYKGQEAVISEQGQRDRDLLGGYYTRWLQTTRALQEAESLRGQISETGDAILGSSALVLTLLKLQAYTQALDPQDPQLMDIITQPDTQITAQATNENAAASAPALVQSTQPVQVQVADSPLQLNLDDKSEVSRDDLLVDADALIAALTLRLTTLEGQIAELSEQLLSGNGAQFVQAAAADTGTQVETIREQVPILLAPLSRVTGTLDLGTAAIGEQLASLLALEDLQVLATAQSSQPLQDTIARLEEDLRVLQSELEDEKAESTRLTQERDLALEAYDAVSSKIAELNLSRAAASSEVRFAAPGVPAAEPVSGASPILVAAAGAVFGLILGVIVAFVADAMGHAPFLSRRRYASSAALPV